MASLKNDLEFGLNSEEKVKGRLEQFFDCKLTKQSNFCKMDFRNDSATLYVELKTRRIKHNQYDTIMIGANKVRFCVDEDKDYYFVFSCLDGIWYIKYEAALFKTFDYIKGFERGTRVEAHANYPTDVVLIPTKLLKKMNASQSLASMHPECASPVSVSEPLEPLP